MLGQELGPAIHVVSWGLLYGYSSVLKRTGAMLASEQPGSVLRVFTPSQLYRKDEIARRKLGHGDCRVWTCWQAFI